MTYLTERQAMRPRRTPSAATTVDRLREIPDLATQVYASRDTPHRPGRPTTASVATQAPRVSSEMATDDIATSVHGLMSRSHAETGG